MTRKDVEKRIHDLLDESGLRYELTREPPGSPVVRFDTETQPVQKILEIEEELHRNGIDFDTGYDLLEGKREWRLEPSRLPLRERRVAERKRTKKPNYAVGDVLSVPLDEYRMHAFCRVLAQESPMVFVEFFKFVAATDPSVETLKDTDWLLRIYTSDLGIVRFKRWRVIGNLPSARPVAMPLFWLKDPLDGRVYLFSDPVHQRNRRVSSMEEIEQLHAQPGYIYGYKAAEAAVKSALAEAGLV